MIKEDKNDHLRENSFTTFGRMASQCAEQEDVKFQLKS